MKKILIYPVLYVLQHDKYTRLGMLQMVRFCGVAGERRGGHQRPREDHKYSTNIVSSRDCKARSMMCNSRLIASSVFPENYPTPSH
jgi:hypothetical protein